MPGAPTSDVFRDMRLPFAMAHRGGTGFSPNAGIENTLSAFATAWALGLRFFETDVRSSSDGVAVVVHDEHLDRLCDVPGRVADHTWAELSRLRVDGREPLARLADLLAAFPDARLNIDVKADDAVAPTVAAISAAGAGHRVCLATFSDRRIRRLRRLAGPEVATSCSSLEVAMLRLGPHRRVRGLGGRRGALAAQVPWRTRGVTVLTPGFVRNAHALGLQVHVWTVDDPAAMRTLLALGVDALITDRIDLVGAALTGIGPGL